MKVIFELQNINGNNADLIGPDGSLLLSQWYFSIMPPEAQTNSGSNDGLARDLISLKTNGIKINYDVDP